MSRGGLNGMLLMLVALAPAIGPIPGEAQQPQTPDRSDQRFRFIRGWVEREDANIREDSSFWVFDLPTDDEPYPWDDLRIEGDSVWVPVPTSHPDTRLIYHIYGHLHLMARIGRQEEWLPEAPDAVGYELERAILSRSADAWLLARTVFEVTPYGPLDELAYAKEAEFLDAFILTARPDEFAAVREDRARSNPSVLDAYYEWFVSTFGREPPGRR